MTAHSLAGNTFIPWQTGSVLALISAQRIMPHYHYRAVQYLEKVEAIHKSLTRWQATVIIYPTSTSSSNNSSKQHTSHPPSYPTTQQAPFDTHLNTTTPTANTTTIDPTPAPARMRPCTSTALLARPKSFTTPCPPPYPSSFSCCSSSSGDSSRSTFTSLHLHAHAHPQRQTYRLIRVPLRWLATPSTSMPHLSPIPPRLLPPNPKTPRPPCTRT